jgi:molybdopterin molybdotransferase
MIDICSQDSKPLLSIDEALEKIKATIQPIVETETIALQSALGRVLAEPAYSKTNSPPDRNAAMDGYAFFSADVNAGQSFSLDCVGTSWAGRPYTGPLITGQCIRIFTGAVLPSELDSVIMQEQVTVDGLTIHFPDQTTVKQHVREVGEDIKLGGLLFEPPKKLSAIDLGFLASAGVTEVTVKRSVRVAIFSTGDELIELGQPLASGQIYDSNRHLLNGLLSDPAYSVTDKGVVADEPILLEARFTEAAESHDVIITTGGASVGEADYINEILNRCGEVNFWKLAIKPGKPLAFGRIGDCYFFGLPGNPVAVVVTHHYFVEPALKQVSGALASKPLFLTATCTSTLKKSKGRQEYQRGILTQDSQGEFFVASSGRQGSNILKSMTLANCYIVLPVDCQDVQVGDKVRVELMQGVDLY